jgi:MFS family permease
MSHNYRKVAAVITTTLSIDRVLNGFCRPFFGWVSDHIGRENTMFIALLLEGLGIYALLLFASNALWFVILSGLVFFAWGDENTFSASLCRGWWADELWGRSASPMREKKHHARGNGHRGRSPIGPP